MRTVFGGLTISKLHQCPKLESTVIFCFYCQCQYLTLPILKCLVPTPYTEGGWANPPPAISRTLTLRDLTFEGYQGYSLNSQNI